MGRRRDGARIAVFAAAIGAALVVLVGSSSAGAAVTIGNRDLEAEAIGQTLGLGDTELVQTALPGSLVTAPFDGVLVRWRVAGGGASPMNFRLRVVRAAGAGAFTFLRSSAVGTASPASVAVFATRLPIRAGEYVGVTLLQTGAILPSVKVRLVEGAEALAFNSTADGATSAPSGNQVGVVLYLNADLEPDCDRDGFGDESQDADLSACRGAVAGARPLRGTPGNDRLVGTPGNDLIICGAGDDVAFGGGGNDLIDCGDGDDRVDAGAGADLVVGGRGNDRLLGSSGRDAVRGGLGDDRIAGGADRDRLVGGAGGDRVSGGAGADRLSGNSGNDRLSGGAGGDRLSGGSGRDRVIGGSGRDRLSGGTGRDSLVGGGGRDLLIGGPGRDRQRQ